MAKLLTETIEAWISKRPGSPVTLFVTGELEVPTGGWKTKSTAASPQGINPKIIIVDVEAIRPTGIVNQMISRVPFRYEESPPKEDYTNATVRHDGQEHTVEVVILT
ncbi:hypothetical protein [Enterovirga sp.]|uniref:hypothetical protein n=1 Tax=Enterovirga sp. TaxID=2026350 RepID=UPI002C3FD095|nr:hypothetical protein [Enterovirga sp.]HMO30792.1 hypothetical protein [Enterovirga sp.]